MTSTQPQGGLWRTKSVEQSIADTDEPGTQAPQATSAPGT